jgi:hypothetical protein
MHLNKIIANFLKLSKKKSDILSLRPQMAQAAQKVYDEWDQSGEEGDVELGFGGICQDIAEAIVEVLDHHGIEAGSVSQSIGEQHVYAIAQVEEGVFEVDISPYTYERGAGYTWKKKPNVKFAPDDIAVSLIDKDPKKFEEMIDE